MYRKLAIPFLAAAVAAQSAELSGRIYDASNATVPKAEVVVRNRDTTAEFKTVTGDAGEYRVAGLPGGQLRTRSAQAWLCQVHAARDQTGRLVDSIGERSACAWRSAGDSASDGAWTGAAAAAGAAAAHSGGRQRATRATAEAGEGVVSGDRARGRARGQRHVEGGDRS